MASFYTFYNQVKQYRDAKRDELVKTMMPMFDSMANKQIFENAKQKELETNANQAKVVGEELGVPDLKTTYTNPETGQEETLSANSINTILNSKLDNNAKVKSMKVQFAANGLEWKPEYDNKPPEEIAGIAFNAGNEKMLADAEVTMPEVVNQAKKKNKNWEKATPEQKITILKDTAAAMGKQAEMAEWYAKESYKAGLKGAAGDEKIIANVNGVGITSTAKTIYKYGKTTTTGKGKNAETTKQIAQFTVYKGTDGFWYDIETGAKVDDKDSRWLNEENLELKAALQTGSVVKGKFAVRGAASQPEKELTPAQKKEQEKKTKVEQDIYKELGIKW